MPIQYWIFNKTILNSLFSFPKEGSLVVSSIRYQIFFCFLAFWLTGFGDSVFYDLSDRHRTNPFSGWKMRQCCRVALVLGTMYMRSKGHVACVPFLYLHFLSGPLCLTLRHFSPLLQNPGLGKDFISSFISGCKWLISLSLFLLRALVLNMKQYLSILGNAVLWVWGGCFICHLFGVCIYILKIEMNVHRIVDFWVFSVYNNHTS